MIVKVLSYQVTSDMTVIVSHVRFQNCYRNICVLSAYIHWQTLLSQRLNFCRNIKTLMYLHLKSRMIFKYFLICLVCLTNGTQVGKIRILNKTSQMIRVHLSPSPTWSYFDQPNNRTLKRDSKHKVGSNSIL